MRHLRALALWAVVALCMMMVGSERVASAQAPEAAKKRMNVLFIAVDDLKPALGCYGDGLAVTPNLDRLASRGLLFNRAYCQQAVCSPSRYGVMTGRRPDSLGIYDLATHLRDKHPDVVTMPQAFMKAGYHAEGMGKIYHTTNGNKDDVASWSVPSWDSGRGTKPVAKAKPAPANQTREQAKAAKGKSFAVMDKAEEELPDGKIAARAIQRLGELKGQEKPFFLALGFHKPHLPFRAPKKYWDLHDPAKFKLATTRGLPKDAPGFVGNGSGELRNYQDIPDRGPIDDALSRQLIHGYYAAASFTDAQIGKVLDALEKEGLAQNTVVILWGDHGWHLGDHGLWNKHTNFEQATRSTLMIHAPGMKSAGAKTDALVEFVDMYPTLCELTGVAPPAGLEGTSFVPLIENPKRAWKTAAFHQWPKNIRNEGQGMGRSIRTERYRLTEWTVAGKEFSAVELYDYAEDPEETVNLAGDAKKAEVVAELKKRLKEGWVAAKPK